MFPRGGNARKRGVDAALSRSGSGFRGGSGIVFVRGEFREHERGNATETAGRHRALLFLLFGFDGAQQRLRVRRGKRAFLGEFADALFARFRAPRLSRVRELRERAGAALVVVEVAASPLPFSEAGDERSGVDAGAAELGGDKTSDEFSQAYFELCDVSSHGFIHFRGDGHPDHASSSHFFFCVVGIGNDSAAEAAAQMFLRGVDAAKNA